MTFLVLKLLFIRIMNYNKNRIVFKIIYFLRTYHIYLLNLLLSIWFKKSYEYGPLAL